MNKQAIFHRGDSEYSYPTSSHSLTLRLRVSKDDTFDSVMVVYGVKYKYSKTRNKKEMDLICEDDLYKYYGVTLEIDDVRQAYIFELRISGKTYYYSEEGLSESFDYSRAYFNFFQFPYIQTKDIVEVVEWTKDAIFYQIFVDRFNKENNASKHINMKWGGKPTPTSFAGGTIDGITEKLDYLKELGINTIYLTPVFVSSTNHKYDISDYENIDPHFGTNEEFGKLVTEIHNRKMHIVLDAVFNHCSENTSYYKDVVKNGNKSPYKNWFIFNPKTDRYETFAFCSYMPKWNTNNEEVQQYLINIGLKWIKEYDIDGWRLDVSDEVSHDFWKAFRKAIKETKKDAILIGENWHDSLSFLNGDEFDGVMNYPFTKAMTDLYSDNARDAHSLACRLNNLLMRYKGQIDDMMLNLLDSHDTHRFYTLIDEDDDKLLSALSILFFYTGIPCIYYGTELPLEGGYDPDSRRCFKWDRLDTNSNHFKKLQKLIAIKKIIKNYPISIYSNDNLLMIERKVDDYKMILVTNLSNEECNYKVVGEIIDSNKYVDGSLKGFGYIVIKN